MVYNKLVRDRIPEIIAQQGERPIVRILEYDEHRACLESKLDEEVAEYHADKSLEELADILEVVYALAEAMGYTRNQLIETCQKKRDARGGFSGGVFLIAKEG